MKLRLQKKENMTGEEAIEWIDTKLFDSLRRLARAHNGRRAAQIYLHMTAALCQACQDARVLW
jgi:hypothetical protein